MNLEQKIKDFAHGLGVEIVGVAGPDRLNGPPSLDPGYTMSGARSIVSFAMPMDVDAIYAFLSKKSPVPHNIDQLLMNQRIHRIGTKIAGFISSQGHRAQAVPSNNSYRRAPDAFATHPDFSHRFGAIAAGIGAQGLSGNVMTEKHGAAVYLDTVVTDAVLKSDPPMHPRHFMDNWCSKCKVCDKVCVAGMFVADQEEYVLLNNELHPRGKRRGIDYCNASCFGLHAVSRDKKWSTWGRHWIDEWVGKEPQMSGLKLRYVLMRRGATAGDSTARYDTIRRLGSILWPEELVDNYIKASKATEDWDERSRLFAEFSKSIGQEYLPFDPNVLTCGQCATVCGPTVQESGNRYHALINSGFVVSGERGETGPMVNVKTYEQAVEMRRKYPFKKSWMELMRDMNASTVLWHKFYFGIEPKSIFGNWSYQRKLRKAVAEKAKGHREARA